MCESDGKHTSLVKGDGMMIEVRETREVEFQNSPNPPGVRQHASQGDPAGSIADGDRASVQGVEDGGAEVWLPGEGQVAATLGQGVARHRRGWGHFLHF